MYTNTQTVRPETLSWTDIRERVQQINPELAGIIDEIEPNDEFRLVKVCYPFGVNILENGICHLPTPTGKFAAIDHHQIPPSLRSLVDYNPCPLGLVLNKSVEVYIKTSEDRVIPFKLFEPGRTFGVWSIMEQPQAFVRKSWDWNISSGARTLFMLPKIADRISHNRLCRAHGIRSYVPNTLCEHWKVFAEIAKAHANESHWGTDVLFFTDKWLDAAANDKAWSRLRNYWTEEAWRQAYNWVGKMNFDFGWDAFISELERRQMKARPYMLDTLKHLLAIGSGTIPGFKPADASESTAPTSIIQQAYVDDYQLKSYAPTIMQPAHLTSAPGDAVYYSLQFPTLPEKPQELKSIPSVMKVLRELKNLVDVFMDISRAWPKPKDAQGYDFVKTAQLDYFHNEHDNYEEISPTALLPDQDANFSKLPKVYQDRRFPENGHFLRGCVKISIKSD
ncbi:MAG: hypothetical protein CMF50_08915 [Legionellales bacterium]|nr:hypothetical protein [Legionellales bacterium]|tara:strand:- start:18496 stop:19842 length:1347 start_codon:yes stop_codon:yes gene_type:complete